MRDVRIEQGDNSYAIIQEGHGGQTLNQLPRDGLIDEAAAAQILRKKRKQKRQQRGGKLVTLAAFCAIVSISVAYWVFVKNKSLTLAEIFNAFTPAMLPSILSVLLPGLVAIATGPIGYDTLTKPSAAEEHWTNHLKTAKQLAEVKDWDSGWNRDVRARRKDPNFRSSLKKNFDGESSE
ncbi:hypothetical protein ACWKWA_13370 [Dermacoccus abyssi]